MSTVKRNKANIFKATIIMRMKPGGEIIFGEGTFEATKTVDGEALFTARFTKPFPKKKK